VGEVVVAADFLESGSPAVADLLQRIADQGIPLRTVRAGDEFAVDPHCRVRVLHPDGDDPDADPNDGKATRTGHRRLDPAVADEQFVSLLRLVEIIAGPDEAMEILGDWQDRIGALPGPPPLDPWLPLPPGRPAPKAAPAGTSAASSPPLSARSGWPGSRHFIPS
jgi:hypothetical protein